MTNISEETTKDAIREIEKLVFGEDAVPAKEQLQKELSEVKNQIKNIEKVLENGKVGLASEKDLFYAQEIKKNLQELLSQIQNEM